MAEMQIKINIDGNNNAEVGITITGVLSGGWSNAWEHISPKIANVLAARDEKRQASADETMASLAALIGKSVEETRQLCKDTGKDLSVAMLEVALRFAQKQDK